MHDQSASEHTSQLISDLSAVGAAISAVTEREFNGLAQTVDHAPPDLAPRLFAYLAHASDHERARRTRCPLPLRALQKAIPHDQPRVKTDERPLRRCAWMTPCGRKPTSESTTTSRDASIDSAIEVASKRARSVDGGLEVRGLPRPTLTVVVLPPSTERMIWWTSQRV